MTAGAGYRLALCLDFLVRALHAESVSQHSPGQANPPQADERRPGCWSEVGDNPEGVEQEMLNPYRVQTILPSIPRLALVRRWRTRLAWARLSDAFGVNENVGKDMG
jgi:hypothetical protein